MSARIILALTLASVLSASAQPRTWKSADGKKTFQGEFISRDGAKITIHPVGAKPLTFGIEKLHPDDQEWVNLNHPVEPPKVAKPSTGVFDNLQFGDTPEEVYGKLKQSRLVEREEAAETVFGTNTISNDFRLREKIGGLPATIRFGWSGSDTLNEITIQTEAHGSEDSLKPCWKELIDMLTSIHGPAVQSAAYPNHATIRENTISGSHLWKIENSGTAMLGTTRTGNEFSVVIQFSKKSPEEIQKIQHTPAP